jgi:N,N-dimethylformamidase
MISKDRHLLGYCDRISVRAGDTIQFMISALGVDQVNAQMVRLIHGDEHPDGPGYIDSPVSCPVNGQVRVAPQFTQVGSFAQVSNPSSPLAVNGPFTLYAYIWPTTPKTHRQALLGRWHASHKAGYSLAIDASGHLEFRLGDGISEAAVTSPTPLRARCWYLVVASYDPGSRSLRIFQDGMISTYNSIISPALPYEYRGAAEVIAAVRPRIDNDIPFLIAGASFDNSNGRNSVGDLFNGKIDRCGVVGRVLLDSELLALSESVSATSNISGAIASWNPTIGYGAEGIGDRIVDEGPHQLHADGYNRPIRAMTGVNWTGRDDCYRLAPEQYGGVHYHEDALIDCHWHPVCRWTIPLDLPSGCYALKLNGPDMEEHIPFFVRATVQKAPIAVLMPTATYLAYANEQIAFSSPLVQPVFGRTPIVSAADQIRLEMPELGLSTYDCHLDGEGVCFSSYRRPVPNMRPKYRMAMGSAWAYPADLSIIGWLEAKGYHYEVVCDEDLHREGVSCIASYRLLISGSHPEYYSEKMLDATQQFTQRGGRLIYTGGNGYYWVSCFRENEPWCMEVRKLDSGTRTWQAMPGEYYNQTEAVRGGAWRNRGRAPQKLVGVGFTAQGFDLSQPYTKLSDAEDPAVSWIFDGVQATQFGATGLALGGAAGLEVDRYDLFLGTPPTARLLATACGLSDNYPHVSEEVYANSAGQGATADHQCRADLVYFRTCNGGAVFSTGSIAWASALPVNGFDNDVSTIMTNVVNAFVTRVDLAD